MACQASTTTVLSESTVSSQPESWSYDSQAQLTYHCLHVAHRDLIEYYFSLSSFVYDLMVMTCNIVFNSLFPDELFRRQAFYLSLL